MSRRTLLGSLAGTALVAPDRIAHGTPAGATTRVHAVGGVGSGATLAGALAGAAPGDVIEVHADLDGDTGVVEQPGLTLRGIGTRRTLHAGGRSAEGKATLVVRAPGTVVENLAFRGARNASHNGAGIRFEDGSLTLRRCAFLDNEIGLLSASRPAMSLRVLDCEFGAAPRHEGRLRHLLYVGAIGALELSGCLFHGGFRGHFLKSRARVNVVIGNRFDDLPDGAAAYEIEFPNGGRCIVAANVVAQSPRSMNAALLSIGAEAGAGDSAELWIVHNTLLNAGDERGRFVHLWPERLQPPLRIVARNNLFVGPGTLGLDAATAMSADESATPDGNHRVDADALRDPAGGDFRLRPGSARDLLTAPLPAGLPPLLEFTPPIGSRPWPGAPAGAAGLLLAPGAHPLPA